MTDLTTAVLELDRATSTPELVQATRGICALNDANAAPTLIKVLSYNNPAVAAIATQGLIALGRAVVPDLLSSMDTGNYGARAWVVKALAALRDPRGLDLLDHALRADIAPSVRRSATRGLAELDLDLPNQADELVRCCEGLLQAGVDDEWVVRYAAAYGLERRLISNAVTPSLQSKAMTVLSQLASAQEPVKVVRQRADLALLRVSNQ